MESTPDEFLAGLKKVREAESVSVIRLVMPVWAIALSVCVSTALGAIALLFYNYFNLLVGYPIWPSP